MVASAHVRRRFLPCLLLVLLARQWRCSFVAELPPARLSSTANAPYSSQRRGLFASVLAGSVAAAPDIARSEAPNVADSTKASEEEKQLEGKIAELKSKLKEKKQVYKDSIKPLQEQIKKAKAAYKQQTAPLQKDVKDLQAKLKGLQKDRSTKAPSTPPAPAPKGSSDESDEFD